MDDAERAEHHDAQREAREQTIRALRGAAQDRRFWVAVAWLAFIALTPFPASAQIYYETDALHFSKQFIGDLNAWSAVGSIVGGTALFILFQAPAGAGAAVCVLSA